MKRLLVLGAAALVGVVLVVAGSSGNDRGVALASSQNLDGAAGCGIGATNGQGAAQAGQVDLCTPGYNGAAAGQRPGGATATWDPGNIISDAVFYNIQSMTVGDIRQFIATKNADCPASNSWCARTMRVSWSAYPADEYCQAVPARANVDAAEAIAMFSTACGINPQVMLVTWQKESQGLERKSPSASSYQFAWGWNCPDTGPGGAPNCAPDAAGFINQLHGMAWQWAKYRVTIPKGHYRYLVGKTVDILWNIEESGCGSAPVTIRNVATASLYVYTPYQPNAASLAAYPGEGDWCSSYGNRNFFRMFQKYFGDTGGGLAAGAAVPGAGTVGGVAGAGVGGVAVSYSGTTVTIPNVPDVPTDVRGRQIQAPTPKVAAAIAAGLSWLGTPYSWGGGGPGGPSLGICGPSGAENDCHVNGFDCSGLTSFVAAHWGTTLPRLSGEQRNQSRGVPWDQAQPGDLQGSDGHITIYLGQIDGQRMRLEAPYSGAHVRISTVPTNADSVVYRYWTR